MVPYPLRPIRFLPDAHTIPAMRSVVPGALYYATPQQLRGIGGLELRQGRRVCVRLPVEHAPPIRTWQGEDLNDRQVAYYPGGHIGDALCHTAAVRALRLRYPRAAITVFAGGSAGDVWRGNRDIAPAVQPSARPVGWAFPDHEALPYLWIIPRPLPYLRRASVPGRPQRHYYRLLEEALGIAIDIKRPYIYTTEVVRAEVGRFLAARTTGRPHIVVQLTASEPCRTPMDGRPGYWHARLAALVAACPDHAVVVIGQQEDTGTLELDNRRTPLPVIWALATTRPDGASPSVPALLEIIRTADLVIAPDSLGIHAAAAFDIPCLALWNDRGQPHQRIPDPFTRLATYPHARWISMYAGVEEFVQHAQQHL